MTTDERFEALEKTVGRQRMTIAALVLVAVATAVMAAAPQSRDARFDQISAKSLWIENDAGETQAFLGVDETGGVLAIYNAAEERQVTLGATKASGRLAIYNTAGKRQATLAATQTGGRLLILDKTGTRIVGHIP